MIIVRTQDLKTILEISGVRIYESSPPKDLAHREPSVYQIQALVPSDISGEFRPYVLANYTSLDQASYEFERLSSDILNGARFFQFSQNNEEVSE